MEIQKYLSQKKKIEENLLKYIDDDNGEENDDDDEILKSIKEQVLMNINEFDAFIRLLISIIDNHQRTKNIIDKIEHILFYFKDDLQHNYSNSHIFERFNSNNRILQFLISKNIIKLDKPMLTFLTRQKDLNENRYRHYFYPELERKMSTPMKKSSEFELKKLGLFQNFEERRKSGENDSYLSQVIRNDLIEEFIEYINMKNISYESKLKLSLFETNHFLQTNKPTIIEYASFYGSLQIFQYLAQKNVELRPKIWLYVIHSNNAELIEYLIDNQIQPEGNSYVECLIESIKCHHNEVAHYLLDNFFNEKERTNVNRTIANKCIEYCNYSFLPDDIDPNYLFRSSCAFNNIELVKLLLNKENVDINEVSEIFNILIKQDKINIEPETFKGCTQVKDLIIPDTIGNIKEYSFFNFCSLIKITLPTSLTIINRYSFADCFSLKEIIIPPSVTTIGEHSFEQCIALEKIELPPLLKTIEDSLFYNCRSLTDVKFPPNLIEIKNCAFKRCIKLTNVIIPSTVISIGENAFKNCASIINIEIPPSVEIIGKEAFKKSKIQRINILSTLIKEIKQKTFYKCNLLKEAIISSSVTKIEDDAFFKCESLQKVVLPASLQIIEKYAFFMCNQLTEDITFSSSIKYIGFRAFDGCYKLSKVAFPDSIKIVKIDNKFKLSLEKILPNTVYISNNSFRNTSFEI